MWWLFFSWFCFFIALFENYEQMKVNYAFRSTFDSFRCILTKIDVQIDAEKVELEMQQQV